ncbi:hypothetical protein TorRG33x02_122870 [Trema orientale]|uniref:Uncharacterized protein n=1 Tax=Trema orientale TaxID=63057 RepID=A0A2P5F2D3_TREOI|nr:hypothetical protein TorRG33x02_122870 [Trema orientale]
MAIVVFSLMLQVVVLVNFDHQISLLFTLVAEAFWVQVDVVSISIMVAEEDLSGVLINLSVNYVASLVI